MRIVAGRVGGRPLETPSGREIRPTSDRTREALFAILESGSLRQGRNLVRGARLLDAFAGTGAVGLEALSRGAERCIFLEKERAALELMRRNAAGLGLAERCEIRLGDALQPPRAQAPCDLVFLDPPYGRGLLEPAVRALGAAGWIVPESLVIIETDGKHPEALPAELHLLDQRRYGKAGLLFAEAAGATA